MKFPGNGGKSYSTLLPRNPLKLLTLARDLKRRRAREQRQLFVAEGVRAVEELLRAGLPLEGLLVAPQLAGAQRGEALRQRLQSVSSLVTEVTEREFASAAETESPQGVLAIARIPEARLERLTLNSSARFVVLDGVQDPGNVGTILRTAAALGATATVALPGTVDLWNAKVVRSAMGAQFHHPVLTATWQALDLFRDANSVELWGADMHGEPLARNATPPARLGLVVGNEGAGLSEDARKRTKRLLSLPMSGSVESLNVAVATGILLYELRA